MLESSYYMDIFFRIYWHIKKLRNRELHVKPKENDPVEDWI